jgi:uncharacterized membrane protein YgdD (TMEM256/DUF423 family)
VETFLIIMDKKIIKTAAILGFIAIAFGAFGAHILKKMVGILELTTFETGVRYQMYHALFLLFIGTTNAISDAAKKVIYFTTLSGTLLFSGSLYFLALNNFLPFNFKPFGFVTPIGGLLFLTAWFWLFVNYHRKKH